MDIDVNRMVRAFGNPEMLAATLAREGFRQIRPIAVRRWIERGNIPTEHLMALMIVARRIKMPFDPISFVTHESEIVTQEIGNG